MSIVDPLEALARPDRPIEPRADFAERLLASCLAELRPRARRGMLIRSSRLQIAVAVALLALALAVVATATYLALRTSPAVLPPRPAQVSVFTAVSANTFVGQPALARISVVDSGGRLRTVWECPRRTWCGDPVSLAWSPDGRRLAMSLDEFGGRSGYIGLHVVDLASGVDRHLGSLPIAHLERTQPMAVLRRLYRASVKTLGCGLPYELAWSPDSRRIAYVCGNDLLQAGFQASIYIIRADGTGRVRVRTGTFAAYWPSWSPDGTRIVFATRPHPDGSAVYTVRLDGTGRQLVARDASAPAWSPDGKAIAFDAPCGVRVVGSSGAGLAPAAVRACLDVRGDGLPAWSPDGKQLAIGTSVGVAVVHSDGRDRRLVTTDDGGVGPFGVARPAWAPASALARLVARRHKSGL